MLKKDISLDMAKSNLRSTKFNLLVVAGGDAALLQHRVHQQHHLLHLYTFCNVVDSVVQLTRNQSGRQSPQTPPQLLNTTPVRLYYKHHTCYDASMTNTDLEQVQLLGPHLQPGQHAIKLGRIWAATCGFLPAPSWWGAGLGHQGADLRQQLEPQRPVFTIGQLRETHSAANLQ